MPNGKTGKTGGRTKYSGISFVKSLVGVGHVEDGLSKTILVMEKYLKVENYLTGGDAGDNETWCTGFNNDNFRTTAFPPIRDSSLHAPAGTGSAHSEGLYVCMADGSVQQVPYSIELTVWQAMGHRADGAVIPKTDN